MAENSDDKKKDLLTRMIILGSSFVYLSKDLAEDIVDELEEHRVLAGDDGKQLADKIRGKVRDHKDNAKEKVKAELRDVINELGIATKDDLKDAKPSKSEN